VPPRAGLNSPPVSYVLNEYIWPRAVAEVDLRSLRGEERATSYYCGVGGVVTTSWSRRISIGAGLAVLMAATIFFGLQQDPTSFDDAYITYRYARNIALGRGFVYNVGERVLGTTTPMYTLLLAGLSFIWPDIPRLSHSIGLLAWMLCVPVIYGVGRVTGRERMGMAAAAFVGFNPLFLGILGMETPLYVLLALSTFYFYLREQPIWAALCAGLAFLTRWDGILVVGVFLFAEMLKNKGRFSRAGLVCAAIIIPWLAYSCVTFGSLLPNSFFAKVGQGWNPRLGGAEIGPFGRGLAVIATSAYAQNRLFLLLPIFAVVGFFSVFYRKVKWWPLLLWTMTYIGAFVALGVLQFPWYYPPLVPTFALLTAEGIEAVAQYLSLHLTRTAGQVAVMTALCALCLLPNVDWLVKSQRRGIDPHSATYLEVARWLQTHTPPDSSVALLEIGIIGFYSDRTVVDTMGLVSPEMVGHLGNWLQTLQFAVNHYWPDYVVALQRTAWVGVVHEPWFEEAYVLEATIKNSADPVAPVHIYRRRAGFPRREFALDSPQDAWFDRVFVLRQIQVAEHRVGRGDDLHVQLTWEALADIHADYRFQFDLVNTSDGQRWMLASDLQPMRGGNPTAQWRRGDHIIDTHSLRVPAEVSAGSYLLQLVVIREDGPPSVSDSAGNELGYTVAGPIQIGGGQMAAREPNYPVAATFGDNISLVGYDLDRPGNGSNLLVTLYWKATDPVSNDYTAFVHLLSPEDKLIAQHDSSPLLPTSLWIPGTRVIDLHTLALPSGLAPSYYEIRVGLYHWPDLERVPIVSSGCLDAANDTLLVAYISFDRSQGPSESTCSRVHWIGN